MFSTARIRLIPCLLTTLLGVGCACLKTSSHRPTLFDGRTLAGWDGDQKLWRVENGEIVGGHLGEKQPRNEFLATVANYTNFVLQVKFKLTGTEGFVNSGVQLRSQRVPNDSEMSGYQADIGDGWYGTLYDESRRNKPMAKPAEDLVKATVKVGQWNDYEIRAVGPHITLKINGVQLVDYTEADPTIPQFGKFGLQVHGGGKTEVHFKDFVLTPLP